MPKITKQPNFPTKLFVVASLAAFVLFAVILFLIKINLTAEKRLVNAPLSNSSDKYYFNENYKNQDPFITKVPSLKDMLAGPIVSQADPALGLDNAPITIVEFSDYECGFCQEQEQTLKQMIEKYNDKIKLVWKDYPERDENSISFQAAVSARCAQEQNQFWPYHDLLFENNENLNQEKFLELASDLNLDINQFNECLIGEDSKNLIRDNIEEANALDVSGIPFIFVNDQEVMGEISLEELERIVNIELNGIKN
ncbi:DsbA family protein [Patescibacteria group bacterium]|nr:DsbA family protein [Patescibacteria group bacterium]